MNLKDKKILVTGGGGFLGSHLVQRLLGRGVSRELIIVPRAGDCDLRIRENCESIVQGVDVVIHAAGTTGNTEFHRDHPAEIFYDNLTMGVELMEAARVAGVEKFVTIGSATEYPENAPLPFREENLWIGFPEPLHAPYTIAKKMLLVQAQAYRAQYGFNAIHLLLTNMYGPGNEAKGGFVITNMINRMLAAKDTGQAVVEAWGTGVPTRDFLYVEDAAEGIVLAAEKYDKPDPVNLGSGWEISIKELTETISHLTGFGGEIRWDVSKPDGQMRRMLDTRKAERELGFRAGTSFEDGLRKTVEWHKSRRSGESVS